MNDSANMIDERNASTKCAQFYGRTARKCGVGEWNERENGSDLCDFGREANRQDIQRSPQIHTEP